MRIVVLFLSISINVKGQHSGDLLFIQNKGQWNAGTDFQAKVTGGCVGVPAKGSVLSTYQST